MHGKAGWVGQVLPQFCLHCRLTKAGLLLLSSSSSRGGTSPWNWNWNVADKRTGRGRERRRMAIADTMAGGTHTNQSSPQCKENWPNFLLEKGEREGEGERERATLNFLWSSIFSGHYSYSQGWRLPPDPHHNVRMYYIQWEWKDSLPF